MSNKIVKVTLYNLSDFKEHESEMRLKRKYGDFDRNPIMVFYPEQESVQYYNDESKENKMVGGKIVDFFIREKLPDFNYDVKFLVNDESNGVDDYCCVCAEIPMAVIPELKTGDPIWWQNPNVYLSVFGLGDVPFRKIGFSGGSLESFYEEKPSDRPKYHPKGCFYAGKRSNRKY